MAIAYGKQATVDAPAGYQWSAGRKAKAFRRPLSQQLWIYFVGAALLTAAVLAILLVTGVVTVTTGMPVLLIVGMVGFVVGGMAGFAFVPSLFYFAARKGAHRARGLVVATDRNGGMDNYHFNQRAIIRVYNEGQSYLFYTDQAGLSLTYGDRVPVSWHGPKSKVCWVHEDVSAR